MNLGPQNYCYPVVQCRAREHFEGESAIHGTIVIPHRALPIPRNKSLWKVPNAFQADWEEWFGCSGCGAVRNYSAADIRWRTLEKQDLGDYLAPGNFYSVQTVCESGDCEERLSFVVDMKSGDADELETRLRKGFFYGMWTCGHRLRPVKEKLLVRRIASLPLRLPLNTAKVAGE